MNESKVLHLHHNFVKYQMMSRAKHEADYIQDFSRPENTHFKNLYSLPHLKLCWNMKLKWITDRTKYFFGTISFQKVFQLKLDHKQIEIGKQLRNTDVAFLRILRGVIFNGVKSKKIL